MAVFAATGAAVDDGWGAAVGGGLVGTTDISVGAGNGVAALPNEQAATVIPKIIKKLNRYLFCTPDLLFLNIYKVVYPSRRCCQPLRLNGMGAEP